MSEPSGVLGDGFWPVHAFTTDAAAAPVESDHLRPAAPGTTPPPLPRQPRWLRRVRALRLVVRAWLTESAVEAQSAPALTTRRLVRGLSRSTRALALRRLGRLPLFDTADYLTLHRDVAADGIAADYHALFLGTGENRALFRPAAIARSLGTIAAHPRPCARPARSHDASLAGRRAPRVGVYASTQGNVFMREIAEDLADALRQAGATVDLLDETADIAARPPLCVFVAPHEFFVLGRGPLWVRDEVVTRAVMLNTEQVQTQWFARALPLVLASRGVIDLCAQTGELLAQTGLPSLHVGLPPADGAGRLTAADRMHPMFRVLPAAARADPVASAPFVTRPIEIAFFGADSPHREAWLARNAGFLAEYENFIHVRRTGRGPIRPGGADGALTRLARHVCGHARVSLNLHRDAYGYLEWHRIVRLGLAAGSVVVSEPCLPHPLLRPGVHYLEENTRQIPDLLEWLLRSPEGRQRAGAIQANGAALLADERQAGRGAARALEFLLNPESADA